MIGEVFLIIQRSKTKLHIISNRLLIVGLYTGWVGKFLNVASSDFQKQFSFKQWSFQMWHLGRIVWKHQKEMWNTSGFWTIKLQLLRFEMELCCYSYTLKCYLYFVCMVWRAWADGNLIIHIQSQSGLLKLCFKRPQAKFWLGKWVSGDPVSYSDLVLLFSTLCTLPVPANPHLSILLEGAWENPIKSFTGKSFIGLFAFWKRIWKEGSVQPKGMKIRGSQENRRRNCAGFSQISPSGWFCGQIRLTVTLC